MSAPYPTGDAAGMPQPYQQGQPPQPYQQGQPPQPYQQGQPPQPYQQGQPPQPYQQGQPPQPYQQGQPPQYGQPGPPQYGAPGGPPPVPGQPIAMQPMPGGAVQPAGWMPTPGAPANCPPGLEYLAQIDQLLVKQKMEAIEAFTGFETNNKYEIRNTMGQRVYIAVEDTCCCTRICCGSSRPFDIKVMDNHKKEVMHLERPLRCSFCLCFCCLQKMEVQAPPGTLIGYVRQAWSCCHPRYKIQNAQDETLLRIKGPCCRCNICGDIEFEVTSADETAHVGQISKQWSGLAKEIFTDADNFGVTFPLDMDVRTKATILGAVFLIDFMYFEHDEGDIKKEASHLKH